MYCPKCGSENPDNAVFCSSCGTEMVSPGAARQNNNGYGPVYTMKSNGIAAVLSFLVPGLGQIYNGELTKGLVMIVVAVLVAALGFILLFPFIAYIVIWVWGIYDAYAKANDYNEALRTTGHPPW